MKSCNANSDIEGPFAPPSDIGCSATVRFEPPDQHIGSQPCCDCYFAASPHVVASEETGTGNCVRED